MFMHRNSLIGAFGQILIHRMVTFRTCINPSLHEFWEREKQRKHNKVPTYFKFFNFLTALFPLQVEPTLWRVTRRCFGRKQNLILKEFESKISSIQGRCNHIAFKLEHHRRGHNFWWQRGRLLRYRNKNSSFSIVDEATLKH